jgi:YbbR domain-containing protein
MPGRLIHNKGLKITSIALASVVWFLIASGTISRSQFPVEIPVEIENVLGDLAAQTEVKTVKISISAETIRLRELTAQSFRAYVDLRGIAEGTHQVPINVVAKEAGVLVVRVTPERTFVTIEKVSEKKMPVRVRFDGSAAKGKIPSQAVIEPSIVTARGPQSLINKIESATALITLAGEAEEVERIVNVTALDGSGNPYEAISFNPVSVKVRVPIVESTQSKTVGIRIPLDGKTAPGFIVSTISTNPSTLQITGEPALLAGISAVETDRLNLNGASETLTQKLAVILPPGITVVNAGQSEITVIVTVTPIITEREIISSFELINLNANRRVATTNPGSIRVVVSGPASTLAGLSASDVKVRIDLTSYVTPGTYTIELTTRSVSVPSGISVIGINVPSVVVELQ